MVGPYWVILNCSLSAFDCVFIGGWFVVCYRLVAGVLCIMNCSLSAFFDCVFIGGSFNMFCMCVCVCVCVCLSVSVLAKCIL